MISLTECCETCHHAGNAESLNVVFLCFVSGRASGFLALVSSSFSRWVKLEPKKKRDTLAGYFLLGFYDTLIMFTIEVITEFAT